MILRTIISVNQLSVYGAAADLSKEFARTSRGTGKPAANENFELMAIPTEFPIANPISRTDAEAQGNLLREYKQKFAELLEQQKLTKVCSNAGFSEIVDKGQFFITLDEGGPDGVKTTCREHTPDLEVRKLPDTKIGPVLDVKVCYHQGRYGVEIMIESLFRNRTVSWVRIVNGINTYVTEMLQEIFVASV